ncbi:hypothetical protein HIM_04167 [Hirsutella minnesotensis 3608]|uniref:Uncharacterized protein n=1 Tax=Hirsutella minnesotensis 3608 TaxID=1043627 RepID=A0A0F7ZVD8_9HYPO|nr:hypothetical protein HIM_04167 [Hirsutella minnesotensis 3608]
MCTTHIYAFTYPDGRHEQSRRPTLCHASRHGQPCPDNVVFHHPTQYVQYSRVPGGSPQPAVFPGPTSYTAHPFPPTPPTSYTPRSSTPVFYRSGDDSDRSYHSTSSLRRPRRPSSGVYVNGQRVVDLDGHQRSTHISHHSTNHPHHSASRRERIVLVDSPPTPRTPPQVFTGPHTAPSSPSFNPPAPYAPETSGSSRRPVIVDERQQRPYVQIEVHDGGLGMPAAHSRHGRHSSTSSRGSSRFSYSSAAEADEDDVVEEEQRQRRARRDALRHERQTREARLKDRELREKEIRDQRIRQRIAEANAEIASRPVIPMPSLHRRSSATATAPGAGGNSSSKTKQPCGPKDREAELLEKLRKLEVAEKRVVEKRADREREEDEAQKARLRERMVPRRRATVGPGSRRHRVLYDDGMYRWE